MTTLSGIVEKLEDGLGYLEAGLKWLPGDDPRIARLRILLEAMRKEVALSDVRVALAEVESSASAKAQEIADAWPDEPTKR